MGQVAAQLEGGPWDGDTVDDPCRLIVHYYEEESDMIHVYERTEQGRYAYRGAQRGGFHPQNTEASD